jgi:hypothetical protein
MKSISCKEAVGLILKKEEGRLSILQRISLWRHFMICSLCRTFNVQNTHINRAMSNKHDKQLTLADDEKENIVQKLLNDRNP